MQEMVSFLEERVVDGVDKIIPILKGKIIDKVLLFVNWVLFILQLSHFDVLTAWDELVAFQNNNSAVSRDDVGHHGSLNPEKDVVTSDYFGVDIAAGQRLNCGSCITFKLIHESHHPN